MAAPNPPARSSRLPPETSGATLFLPHAGDRKAADSRAARSLPPELREQVTRRLRVVAIAYSAAFFFADFFPPLVTGTLAQWFERPITWVPTLIPLVGGLLFAAAVSTPRLSWNAKVNLGLVFQVVASYGIALSMFLQIPDLAAQPLVLYVLSPSWVGIWMLFYAVVVPAPPRRALLAMIASASAAPVVIWVVLDRADLLHLLPLSEFIIRHVLPYLIIVGMAYVGARTVYQLGTDVTRARELGSYRLTKRLGEGGMGEVWRASHRLLAREAAIKFIRPESIAGASVEEAQSLLKRFELEARATASLTSAHTIDIYDFGVTEEGAFYYVMELLDGLDCDQLVRRFGPLPAGRVVHLMRQVCESLEEAHARGLIHRDVKPANIYVCRSGSRVDFVKVLDFGLVAHRRVASPEQLRLTLPEQAIGTPEFMPPEVALGQAIDGRTDLYGLGCVGYWLATGRPVFEGASFYEIVSKHMHAAPDPPSRHAPGGLPAELDALILECLEKAPERRPAGARELGRKLAAVPVGGSWDDQAEAWWTANLTEARTDPSELSAVGHPPTRRAR